ncbi:MAG: response regulator [Pseudomonadota bacterium]
MLATADPASILVVEDEDAIRGLLVFTLSRTGHVVEEARDCTTARYIIERRLPDIVLLDWMLPDSSGLELLREIRRSPRAKDLPVVMVTSRVEKRDKIAALRSGADDFITKPFSREELILRVEAILRRSNRAVESSKLSFGPLTLDSICHRAMIEDRELTLGRMEFRLLRFLMLSPDRVFSRGQLLDQVWQSAGHVEERTIDVHIMRIRIALGRGHHGRCIETVRGLGYRFAPHVLGDKMMRIGSNGNSSHGQPSDRPNAN